MDIKAADNAFCDWFSDFVDIDIKFSPESPYFAYFKKKYFPIYEKHVEDERKRREKEFYKGLNVRGSDAASARNERDRYLERENGF